MEGQYCRKLKYFRDIPSKEYIGSEEQDGELTFHKVKLYNFNIVNKFTQVLDEKSKASSSEAEETEPSQVESTESSVFETYSFTGMFRDSKRRIDLVLVLPDNQSQDAKILNINFLLNIVKTGFEIELENGLMTKHKNLIFVKIHAPDKVLDEYGEKFGVKKFYRETHVEYLPLKGLCSVNKEREWLELMRNNYQKPLNFSNSERSLFVYKVLLQMRFGEHQNNFGLQRLLNMNIVTDAYALHDGPYFLTRGQDFSKVNGRQILYYNWAGTKNILKLQPINVIHEYFGSRVGFYFAFLQFYNLGLSLAALAGIIITILGVTDKTYEKVYQDVCFDKNNLTVCPRCTESSMCPLLNLKKSYCFGTKLVNVLDNGFLLYYCLFIILWGPILMILWKRRETYLIWMWELTNVKAIVSTRPEFAKDYSKPDQSTETGLWADYNTGINKWIPWILTATFFTTCIYVSFYVPIRIIFNEYIIFNYLEPNWFSSKFEKYITISIFVLIIATTMLLYEVVSHILAVIITRIENHRTIESYERSMALKMVMITFSATFPIMLFYAWFKNDRYVLPSYYTEDNAKFYTSDYLITTYGRNCGVNPCIDEVFISVVVLFLYKQILPKMFFICKNLLYTRTDYNQGKKFNTFPCWEREYSLQSITERTLAWKYNYLALQIGFVTLFVGASPLMPLLALLVNLLDIRYNANQFLLSSRRCLLLDRSGLDIWTNLFMMVAYGSIISTPVLMAWSSRFIKRRYYLKHHNDNATGFFAFTISKFLTSELPSGYDMSNAPKFCYYPGMWLRTDDFNKAFSGLGGFYYEPDNFPLSQHYRLKVEENAFLVLLQYFGLLLVLLAQYLIAGESQDIENSIQIEDKLKETYVTATSATKKP